MTLLRSLIKTFESISRNRICFAFCHNSYSAEASFGSKVEVPSPPKRPLSAYMLFCRENRKELLQQNPSLSTTEQIKMLADKWNHLSEDMKKPYHLSARELTQLYSDEHREFYDSLSEDQAVIKLLLYQYPYHLSAREGTQLYSDEHRKFYDSLSEDQKEEIARLKAKKRESRRIFRLRKALQESGIPKAPYSAYALFVKSEAKRYPSMKSGVEFIRKAAETWKSLPEATKKHFEKQAQDDKVLYAEKMKEWRTKMLLEGNKKVLKAFEELKPRGKSLEFDESDIDSKKKSDKTDKTKAKPAK